MAKKDISKFKEAMFSKTNILKNEPVAPAEVPAPPKNEEPVSSIEVDEVTRIKFTALAKKHNLDEKELINYALKFFLEFEKDLF